MFIDETWASTAMARRYGRARRGVRVGGAVPHGHWKTTTVIAARAVFAVVRDKLDPGEVHKVIDRLPPELRELRD